MDHGDGIGLAPVDLDLAAGTTTVVTGAVGAGKTTLLRAVLGMVQASGEVRWNGELLTSHSLQLRATGTAAVLGVDDRVDPAGSAGGRT